MTQSPISAVRIQAPLKTVFHALTDPAELRVWFAEHAEVELPDRYDFWGRHTLDGDAPHQRVLEVADDLIMFAWTIDGTETTTEIRLAETDGETLVSVIQSHFDRSLVFSGSPSPLAGLETFWALALGNLADHVEGRKLGPKVDYTAKVGEFSAALEIDAPADRVYTALTDSGQATAWFGYPIEIEPEVGGRFAMGGFEAAGDYAAKFVALDSGSATIDWGGMVTSWELAGSGGKTTLTFVTSGFDAAQPPYASWAGWLSGLVEMRRYLEQPNWRSVFVQG
ncbi:SRPBCC family protein [Herbidospora yilanensis]|uniref:SRPBCC family protein n=1 Tax=Herbidospora yilanensis TaxID=354426 RepID=UPI000783E836|nr:SRPBCC domain-containing protein [Herbidospora yilanensis]